MCELEIMMAGMSPERQQAIRDKADRMEIYFNTAGVLFMKGGDEQWVEGMFDEGWDGKRLNKGDSEVYLTKVDKGQLGAIKHRT